MISVQVPSIGLFSSHLANVSLSLGEPGTKIRIENAGKVSENFRESLIFAHIAAENIARKSFNRDIIYRGSNPIQSSGDSGGLIFALGMLSLLTGKAIRPGVTGTGRIDLKGEVLPVANILEKAIAAIEAGARTFLLPKEQSLVLPRGIDYFMVGTVAEAWKMVTE